MIHPGQLVVFALVLGSSYALMSFGLSMVYGILKILHVAHAGVYALGAYVGLFIASYISNSFWVVFLLAMLAAGFSGLLIYRGIYYYTLIRPRYIPLIASVGLFIIMEELFRLSAGPYQRAFRLVFAFPGIKTSFIHMTPTQTLIIAVTTLFLVGLHFVLQRTKLGLGWQVCAQDLEMAGAVGVNINHAIALNFIIGSMLAGAAGVLMALYRNAIWPTMGEMIAYKAFVVVVLGGFGNVTGSIVAGFILASVETFLGSLQWFEFPRDAIAFLVLVVILMFRPAGLFGRR